MYVCVFVCIGWNRVGKKLCSQKQKWAAICLPLKRVQNSRHKLAQGITWCR